MQPEQQFAMYRSVRLRLDVLLPRRQLYEFLDEVVALPAVRDIQELPSPTDRSCCRPVFTRAARGK
jgi:hypothetical protein